MAIQIINRSNTSLAFSKKPTVIIYVESCVIKFNLAAYQELYSCDVLVGKGDIKVDIGIDDETKQVFIIPSLANESFNVSVRFHKTTPKVSFTCRPLVNKLASMFKDDISDGKIVAYLDDYKNGMFELLTIPVSVLNAHKK